MKITADVGIIAAGPAGLCAAVSASEAGASVVVFEKANNVGGTANMGMGPFGVESRIQKAAFSNLTKEAVFRKFMDYVHWHTDARLVREYFWKSGDTIDWLEDMGVKFIGATKYFPDSDATWHIVQPEDGSLPGPRAATTMNKVLYKKALELGAKFYLETPAYKILKENGKVCGILARNASGEEIELRCKAVIVATGGFGSNPEMIKEFTGYDFGKNMFNTAVPGLVGDGIKMVWDIGGAHGRMTIEATGGRTPVGDGDMEAVHLGFVFSQANLTVNKQGFRICDESVMQNTSVAANIIDEQTDKRIYNILDDSIIKKFRRNGMPFTSSVFGGSDVDNFDERFTKLTELYPDCFFAADSLEELAEKAGINADNLVETVEEYNDACDMNYDDVFGKSRKYLLPYNGKRFYAAIGTIGGYGTLGGIKVNWKQEVVDSGNNPIPGLWGAGSDINEIYDGTYMFYLPGNTMGFAVNTGRIAGERAAEYALDQD